jgi:hypothetical protein
MTTAMSAVWVFQSAKFTTTIHVSGFTRALDPKLGASFVRRWEFESVTENQMECLRSISGMPGIGDELALEWRSLSEVNNHQFHSSIKQD